MAVERNSYRVRVDLRFSQQRLADLRDGVRSMRLARITEAARERWYAMLEEAEAEEATLAAEFDQVRKAELLADAAKRAQRDAEIRAHLIAVEERRQKILATSGKLAVFVGTKPEDWIEWNGELVVAPRDIAEATELDLRVATENVAAWKDEPSFTGDWAVPTKVSQDAHAKRGAQARGSLWQLDFDEIWDQDWG